MPATLPASVETFMGYRVLGREPKPAPDSPRYASLTKAIAEWRAFAQTSLGSAVDSNCARELEILRDHGVSVAINPRC